MTPEVKVSPVLKDILAATEKRVLQRKLQAQNAEFSPAIVAARKPLDFVQALLGASTAVIAEVKGASPSLGVIRTDFDAVQIAGSYAQAGAAAISVLTEPDFFHGSLENLIRIRQALPHVPLLQKDFIVDEFQIEEAFRCGADAILIILSVLGRARASQLLNFAKSLGLTVLVEVHDADEMVTALEMKAALIGVNNRNLQTMQVTLRTSENLAKYITKEATVISESGIETREEITQLQRLGYSGFLVGTSLMKSANPAKALKSLTTAEEFLP